MDATVLGVFIEEHLFPIGRDEQSSSPCHIADDIGKAVFREGRRRRRLYYGFQKNTVCFFPTRVRRTVSIRSREYRKLADSRTESTSRSTFYSWTVGEKRNGAIRLNIDDFLHGVGSIVESGIRKQNKLSAASHRVPDCQSHTISARSVSFE